MISKITAGIIGGFFAAIVGTAIVIFGIIAMFLFAILGALIGAITGFILSFTPILGSLVIDGFAQFGIENANLTAIGAMLGFIAGFFKSIGKEKSQGKDSDWCS